MNEKKSLVEEALIQMKNVEEAIAENAKGILASTMKEEINQLVKESLSEQEDEDEMDVDVDVDTTGDDDSDLAVDTDKMDIDVDDVDDSTIDLTDASDEEILKVFKAMGEDDGIIVKKDNGNIELSDTNTDSEYLIKLGESTEEEDLLDEEDFSDMGSYENDDDATQNVIDSLFSGSNDEFSEEEEEEEGTIYEIETDEFSEEEEEEEGTIYEIETDEFSEEEEEEEGTIYEIEMEEQDEEDHEHLKSQPEFMDEEEEGTIYEIEMEEETEEMEEELDEESAEYQFEDMDNLDESYNPKKAKKSIKPKGVGIGSGPKFSYKKETGGFNEKKKQGPKSVGTGKAKFEYKKGENLAGKSKIVKKSETKEAARTLGNGRAWGRKGLDKPRTSPRSLKLEELQSEVSMLRQKNEEYRKALNVFREKLNEVAIFNSNLAYATRLFTEHSTTKKEKINILRRFDGVETLKESKVLYKTIKDELGKEGTKSINESVEQKINKTVSTGSSTTLIESKTYENPQFLRIKDLMGKIVQ